MRKGEVELRIGGRSVAHFKPGDRSGLGARVVYRPPRKNRCLDESRHAGSGAGMFWIFWVLTERPVGPDPLGDPAWMTL
jgi:hypothetical protein